MNQSPPGAYRTVMELTLTTSNSAIDPVCGMTVDPHAAKGSHAHQGTTYHFCSLSCLKKFQDDPEKYLSREPGHPHEGMTGPPAPAPSRAGTRYICPMDPDVVSDRPGACPKCGMA